MLSLTHVTHPRAVLSAILFALLVATAFATGLVKADVYPSLHTYGVSIGTDTHYCSAGLFDWHPYVSCQTAQ